jgi:2-polyprenyl-6-methoxyphenol hydroxylase-like FAD-dependent oxidoreductase
MRIVIIGAGLGGLTLLHGLRASGFDARLFERSEQEGAQPASYGIHLNSDGLRALHACLPAENWALIDRAGVPAPNIIRFWDPRRGVLSEIDKRFPEHATDPISKRRAISRGRLRAALLHGTGENSAGEPLVNWGKRFVRYEERGTTVRAYFEDGTHADGDLLIGADGANSRVRSQRLPDVARKELGIVNIAGRVPLAGLVAHALPTELTDGGINNVVPSGTGWMFLSTWDTGDPDIADVSKGATRYVIWAWAAARDSYPGDLDGLDGAALQQLVIARTHTWSDPLRTLVATTDSSTITTVPLRSMPQLPDWSSSRVTLLGDAIHNMTPMAGIGANTALRDADELRRALLNNTGDRGVAVYEQAMREYANQALALSTRNANNAALASPFARAAFRGLLRACTVVPALRRRMFGATVGNGS